jgi:hypothetical protein
VVAGLHEEGVEVELLVLRHRCLLAMWSGVRRQPTS